ncbi:MAG: DNA translocase FtsK 4TM domain-containing protein [Magnetococcales bacterium]|nr:DNA translocase FtsK 4TM domain-containing protein [Magnetococcales bacterium]
MAQRTSKSRKNDRNTLQDRNIIFRIGTSTLLASASIFLFVALLSYNSHDPSFNGTGNGHVANKGGLVGAYLSDFLIQLFGYSSVWVPIFIGLAAFLYIWRSPTGLLWEQVATLPMLATITCVASAMLDKTKTFPLPAGPGGLVGSVAIKALNQTLGHFGTTILLITLGIFSFLVLTRLSLTSVICWLRGGIQGSKSWYSGEKSA